MALFRLDYLVAKNLGVSRSVAAKLVADFKVSVNKKVITEPDKKFEEGVELNVKYNPAIKIEKIVIEVLYEDDNCSVINKPVGVLSHTKGVFSSEATVASWLLPMTKGFDKHSNRAGIVHRLDRATSGVMICAKKPEVLSFFQKQFSTRKVKKVYYALVEGEVNPNEAIIDIPIERNPKDPKRVRISNNGKKAKTQYKTIKTFQKDDKIYSLLELTPKTGRTHQLRVHLAHLGHPIVGDTFYSGAKADRLYLHAYSLEITLLGGDRRVFVADLPDSFANPKIESDE